MQYWSTFLTELEELQRLEELQKRNKDLKLHSVCKNCGKLFIDPRRKWINPRLTCSEKCRREWLSKIRTGHKPTDFIDTNLIELKKKEIIEL